MNSLVADPAVGITPAPTDAMVTPRATGHSSASADTVGTPSPIGIRPSIGPLQPPRSDLEQVLRRCDRLRLR